MDQERKSGEGEPEGAPGHTYQERPKTQTERDREEREEAQRKERGEGTTAPGNREDGTGTEEE